MHRAMNIGEREFLRQTARHPEVPNLIWVVIVVPRIRKAGLWAFGFALGFSGIQE